MRRYYLNKKSLSLGAIIFAATSGAYAQPGVKLALELNPGGSFVAQTHSVQGNAVSSGKDRYSANNIKLDLNSFKSGIELRDTHMKTKYFETAKFPTATLLQGSASNGKFTGQLTVHGVTQPIEGTYSVRGREIVGQFKCTLSQFQIKPAKYMGVGAEDSVDVEVTLPIAGRAR